MHFVIALALQIWTMDNRASSIALPTNQALNAW